MSHKFNFGLEAEFMLANSKTYKPLWYKDVTFETLDQLFCSISLEGVPSLDGLAAEPPHKKLMPFIVEGYGIPDSNMNIVDAFPKGIEIRTPVCQSITDTIEVYKELYLRVREALLKIEMAPVAISHHPTETKFSGPQNKRRHDYWLWAMEVMTTYGPDINLSLPHDLSKNLFQDLEDLNGLVNFYSPAMAALSLASPFYAGKPWLIKGQIGKSYRTFKRSIIAPAIELHPDENNRIEFKVFEMSKDCRDFEAYFHLVLGLFLSKNLKGRSGHQERIYDLGQVAKLGLHTPGVKEALSDLFTQCELVLPKFGFKTDSLKRLHLRLENKEHISDNMLQIFEQTQNLNQVMKEYASFVDLNGEVI